MTLIKMSEKNTKKQILIEHEKALQMIERLKGSSSISMLGATTVDNTLTIEESIKAFNTFSDKVKDDMSVENTVIQTLKEQIKEKKETIKSLYKSTPEITIDTLIKTHKHLLEEQEDNFVIAQNNSEEEIKEINKSHHDLKEDYASLYKDKKDTFSLSSLRSKKEDSYQREKSIESLEKEREALLVDNAMQKEDLKEHYQTKWNEISKKLKENKKIQNDSIQKAKELKEKFEKELDSKVSSIVGRQKANNTYALRDIEQEYSNKITLKKTLLENLKEEEDLLNTQISQVQLELTIVQEKAHILATKTIESKSTTHSFEAMKEVALEQAKGKK